MDFSNSTQPAVSNDHLGPVVSIVTLLLLTISALTLVARLSTRWAVSHTLKVDDLLLGIALIFSVGNGVSTCVEASNGLGSPRTSSSDPELLIAQKADYVAELCYVAGLCLSKLSAIAFLYTLTPDSRHRLLCASYGLFTTVWTVVALLADAFQCSIPRVWLILGEKCFNQHAFWTTFLVLEMVLNFLLIILPIGLLWRLQVSQRQKVAIWCCFGARIFVIAALIVQLVLYDNAYSSKDFLYHSWGATTASEIVLCISYVTPCLPHLRPFLESLESGMLANDGIRRLGQRKVETKIYGSKGAESSHVLQRFARIGENISFPSSSNSNQVPAAGPDLQESDGDWVQGRVATPSLESHASGSKFIKKTTSIVWTHERDDRS